MDQLAADRRMCSVLNITLLVHAGGNAESFICIGGHRILVLCLVCKRHLTVYILLFPESFDRKSRSSPERPLRSALILILSNLQCSYELINLYRSYD
jgi:hypothetical protein